jgi:predicted PurR-regulated permease PerM
MAILALVPLFGTAFVWLPASIYLLVLGAAEADQTMVWRGIGLIIWGALVVSSIDNILKPKIIGDRAGIHPGLILVGALGGLATIGFIGFVIGPLILGLLKTFIDIYEKEELRGNGNSK